MELGDCEVAKFYYIYNMNQYETYNIISFIPAQPDNELGAELFR